MKTIFITVIALFLFNASYAQDTTKTDSAVADFKTYLTKKVLPVAIAVEKNEQGTVVVSFKIDDNKNITHVQVVRSCSREFDAEVLRKINAYNKPISLPPAKYTIGVALVIYYANSKTSIHPVNRSYYQNYLFDSVVTVYR